MSTIAVITPSKGRKSLINVINHTAGLLQDGDMHFVGLDTLAPRYDVATLSNLPKLPLLHAEEMPVLRSVFGNGQRDLLLQLAANNYDWAIFADDDDLLNGETVEFIRQLEPDGKLHLFAMLSNVGAKVVPKRLSFGSVSGGMLCVPLSIKLPKWMASNEHSADCNFVHELLKITSPVLHTEVLLHLDCA